MASKRLKGQKWEFTVKRAGLLEKPLIFTFVKESDGDEYCRKLEALLDRGIIPTEVQPRTRVITLAELLQQYLRDAPVSKNDSEILRVLVPESTGVSCASLDANWVDALIQGMKREKHYVPSTIRAKIGALARATDWGVRKKLLILPDQPFRSLPEGYASYTATDAALAGGARKDEERDRRLEPGEEERIRAVLQGGVLPRKQHRAFVIPHQGDMTTLFDLALETAMRLREIYTLTSDQVDLKGRTINLEKTKNGDKRQVPLSTVAVARLQIYAGKSGNLFPWLDEQRGNLKLTSNYLSKMFIEIFREAGCVDLHFHDARHEATSRLFERTNLMAEEIMKITGHRSHRMVMRYLKLRSSDLAARLW